MNDTLIPYIIFFTGIIFIRFFQRKANQLLSTEEKAKLLDYSYEVAIWRMIPLLVLIIGFGFFMYAKPSVEVIKMGFLIYLALILMSSVISNIMVQRKYKALGFTSSYLKTTLLCSIASLLLITTFCVLIAYPFYQNHSN